MEEKSAPKNIGPWPFFLGFSLGGLRFPFVGTQTTPRFFDRTPHGDRHVGGKMDNAPDIVLEDITSPGFLSKLQLLDHLTRRLLRYRPTNIKQGQKGFEFLEHRPYLPGDDLGQVDWNVYQRLQEVVVKE